MLLLMDISFFLSPIISIFIFFTILSQPPFCPLIPVPPLHISLGIGPYPLPQRRGRPRGYHPTLERLLPPGLGTSLTEAQVQVGGSPDRRKGTQGQGTEIDIASVPLGRGPT